MKHIVALSGGKDSTAMSLRLVEIEPRDYEFVCTPTSDEPEEMFEHWRRLDEWYAFWRDNPTSWAEGESLEESTGHTFRSPGRDQWPASMKELRARFESGDIPKRAAKDSLANLKCRVCRL